MTQSPAVIWCRSLLQFHVLPCRLSFHWTRPLVDLLIVATNGARPAPRRETPSSAALKRIGHPLRGREPRGRFTSTDRDNRVETAVGDRGVPRDEIRAAGGSANAQA